VSIEIVGCKVLKYYKKILTTISALVISLSILSVPFFVAPSANAWSSAQTAVSVFGGNSHTINSSVAVDSSGNVYTTGGFIGTVDFDPGSGTLNLISAGSADVFVSKLNSSGNLIWAKKFGGTSEDVGRSLTIDSSGNVYITGFFKGTVDFDPSDQTSELTSAGLDDIFVSKLDSSGNLTWAKKFGGSLSDIGYAITVDSTGNVYTTGYFEDTVDFDPSDVIAANLTSSGDKRDVFISKLNSSGNLIWAKKFGGISNDIGYAIKIDSTGNVYTTGAFEGTVDFDPSDQTSELTVAGGSDVFVSKLNSSGNLTWVKKFGGTSDDVGRSLTIDSSGNVYTTGAFEGTVDFDPSDVIAANLISAGSSDVFVSKLNSSGNLIWAKKFGGTSEDVGHSLTVDSTGNVYTTGFFQGTADFDPSDQTSNLTSVDGNDVFLSKLNSSGNLTWVKKFGGNLAQVGYSITGDSSGNVYASGSFQSEVDFDPSDVTTNFSAKGATDVFVLKLTPSGEAPAVAAPGFTLSASSESRTVNTAATGFTVNSTGGAIASFSISATPPGMSFNTSTGALTGTPNTVATATNYTITATNASGNATQIFTLTVATAPVSADNSVAEAAPNAEDARKAKEQRELTEILALIPKIGELTLSLGETTKSLYSTKCVKGKSTKFVKKGAKCPKGFVKRK
jgi:hypothetical protein